MRLRRPRWVADLDVEQLGDYAHVLVRAGYLDRAGAEAEVARSARVDRCADDPEVLAHGLVAAAVADLQAEQGSWPAVTDHDRLVGAFEELRTRGLAVLEHVEDHWAATTELERRDRLGDRVPGIIWFTPADVWHAVRHGMLELNLWHGDTANVAPGDALLDDVLGVLERHQLSAHFDEGRIEVTASWQRRMVFAGRSRPRSGGNR